MNADWLLRLMVVPPSVDQPDDVSAAAMIATDAKSASSCRFHVSDVTARQNIYADV